jgi:hypothetical protein
VTPRLWMHVVNATLLIVWAAAIAVGTCSCATGSDRMRAQATDPPAGGMAVVDPAGVISEPLGPVVEDVLAWWSFRYPARATELRAYFGRGSIVVAVQPECPMLSDPWYPPQRQVWAETKDNNTRLCWSRATSGRFMRALPHELGHMALSVLWRELPGDDHEAMKAVAYPWP